MKPSRGLLIAAVLVALTILALLLVHKENTTAISDTSEDAGGITWSHLSSAFGDLPPPTGSTQQTSALILDVNKDGRNDFVIGARRSPGPSLTWYQRLDEGWERFVIDDSILPVEAGGAFSDIDGDGDLDVLMGADAASNEMWWWENPYPNYDPATPWTRRLVKDAGSTKHHDQMFGDFDGDGREELVYWNQGAKALYLAEIPSDPRSSGPWPATAIYSWSSGGEHEGLTKEDIDGDGLMDIVGGGRWFKFEGGSTFSSNVIDSSKAFTRVAAGQLKEGGRPEVVFVTGDLPGPLTWYEWDGSGWVSHTLLSADVDRGHSLEVADINQDGALDIFLAEMRLDSANPDAKSWIFYGDGQGNFTETVVSSGIGNHESKVGDLDGDGDLDLLGKPFNWDTPRVDVWLSDLACTPTLDAWERHVIDNDKPWQSVLLRTADLNGDSLNDVATGGWWYANPGSAGGTWNRNTIGSPLNNLAALHDFDADGDVDILGTEGTGSSSNANFVWAVNDGNGNFAILNNVEPGTGDFLQGVAVGSFGAAADEIALSWHQSAAGVQMLSIPTDPGSTIWAWREISTVKQDEDLSTGDIDRDGDLDLLLGTKWLRNDTASNFAMEASAPSVSGPWQPFTLTNNSAPPDRNELADINGDGRLDAVVGYEKISNPGLLAWYEAPVDATGLWTEHEIATIIGPMSVDVADMDGDGDIDVIAGEHNLANPSSARLFVFENIDGQGHSWLEHVVYTGDEHHDGAQVDDIDNDGDLDIVSIGWSHGRVLVYENKSCTASSPPQPTSTPSPAAPTATGTVTAATATATATDTPSAPPSCTADPDNVLSNPGFELGTQAWSFYTSGSGSFAAGSDAYQCAKAAELTFNRVSSNMQFFQTGFSLKANTRYRLSFAAKSSTGDDLTVYLHRHSSPYTNYGLNGQRFDLTQSWQVFSTDFTTSGFSGTTADTRLRFWFVGLAANGDIYAIDDVLLQEAGASSPPTPSPTNTPAPSPTNTPAAIPTGTPTNTPVAATPTPTATSTATPVAPATATDTPSAPPSCSADPNNVLSNPGFELGTQAWFFYTSGSGSFAAGSDAYQCEKAAELTFNRVGSNMQFFQTGFSLKANTRYRLSFAAKSSTGDDLTVYLHRHSSPYTNYGLNGQRFDLTQTWQAFSTEFTTSGFSGTTADTRLRFWFVGLAANGDIYTIDDVLLQEAGASSPPTPSPTNTPAAIPTDTPTNTPVAATPTPTATSTATPVVPAPPTATATATDTPSAPPSCTADPDNVLSNPGFELGTQAWSFYTSGNSSFAAGSDAYQCEKAAELTFNRVGSNMQLFQTGFSLKANTRYRLSFAAKSSTGDDLTVYLHRHSSPYTNYGLNGQRFDLTQSWQVFSTDFTTSGFSGTTADTRLRFWFVGLAANGDVYWIDDVQLVEISSSSSSPVSQFFSSMWARLQSVWAAASRR